VDPVAAADLRHDHGGVRFDGPRGDAHVSALRLGLKDLGSESAVHGVVLISGLLVIVAGQPDAAAPDVLAKVVATAAVFWLAHVYSGAVAHLGDHHEEEHPSSVRLSRAVVYSLNHSWGMLAATLVPIVILGLGVIGLLSYEQAIWGTLWADVAILAILGFVGVSTWTRSIVPRLVGALATALLGVGLILLKAMIH
jgi:hypothetical protein